MPEIGSSGLMSGDGKRGVGHRPQATAPILDSTGPTSIGEWSIRPIAHEIRVLDLWQARFEELAGPQCIATPCRTAKSLAMH
jgi:hypothetical protein